MSNPSTLSLSQRKLSLFDLPIEIQVKIYVLVFGSFRTVFKQNRFVLRNSVTCEHDVTTTLEYREDLMTGSTVYDGTSFGERDHRSNILAVCRYLLPLAKEARGLAFDGMLDVSENFETIAWRVKTRMARIAYGDILSRVRIVRYNHASSFRNRLTDWANMLPGLRLIEIRVVNASKDPDQFHLFHTMPAKMYDEAYVARPEYRQRLQSGADDFVLVEECDPWWTNYAARDLENAGLGHVRVRLYTEYRWGSTDNDAATVLVSDYCHVLLIWLTKEIFIHSVRRKAQAIHRYVGPARHFVRPPWNEYLIGTGEQA